jgi:hypothetical protein
MQPASEEAYTDQTPGASVDLEDREAQQVARDAVMEIPLFPDLTVMLRKALGYGPHVEMLQHFVYWFHPRHPKMQNRWALYKTYAGWERECGLGRRQVDRGRRTLRARGLVAEKLGQYKRIHYRVNWVALARVLNLYTIAVQIDEGYDLEDELNVYTKGEQIQSAHHRGTRQSVHQGVQSNTGEYAEEYLSENTLLQSGAEFSKTNSAPPPQMNEEDIIDLDDLELTGDDKRHSQVVPTLSEKTAARELEPEEAKDRRFIRATLEEPTEELAEALERYWAGEIGVEELADEMRGKVYLAGSRACEQLRPEQVAEVLEDLELERKL